MNFSFTSPVRLGPLAVGTGRPPVIVAEMSGNHRGSLANALAIVDSAAASGAHAVKIQTYTPDTMTIAHDGPGFTVDDPLSPWYGRKLYDLYRDAATPWEWHGAIFARCRERGLVGFSTPFDESAVDFLESLGVPCYKIASFEAADLPLVRKAAGTGKPLIISTGLLSREELDGTVAVAQEAGCRELILLKCTSAYPADPAEANLKTIPDMRGRYACEIGISDHTLGLGVAVAAVSLGAVLVEKHLTLSRAAGGVDAGFSLEPGEFAVLTRETRTAASALGEARYDPAGAARSYLAFRRSLYAVRDIGAGEKLTPENVRRIRPGYGLAPAHYEAVLGRTARMAIARGTPISWDLIA